MRTLTAAQERIYAGRRQLGWVRVDIEDAGGTFRNMREFLGHDWIVGAEWGEDVDTASAEATITLRRDRGALSLAPSMENSRANVGGALIALWRQVRIYGAVTPGRDPVSGDWVLLFGGRISSFDDAEDVTLTCVDRMADLTARWIETPATYAGAGTAVETVMQDILDDNGLSGFTLYTPVSPGWNVTAFQTESQSVADQLTMLADMIGWSLRWKYHGGTSAFRLTFFTFDRGSTTSLHTFAAGLYIDAVSSGLDISNVRNVVDVIYSDPADLDSTGAPTRKTVTASDATSIAAYGRRWMSIAEAATSNIDTATEAQALADACLADLKDPVATMAFEVPFALFVELGDIYTFAADNVRFSVNRDLSVTAYRHRFTEGEWRTEITGNATPASGGMRRWFRMAGIPGVGPLYDMTGPIAPTVRLSEMGGAMMAGFELPRERGAEVEVHVGPVGFTPDTASGSATFASRGRTTSAPLIANVTNTPIGELRDVVVYSVDTRGNRSTGTRSSSKSARRMGPHYLAAEARVSPTFTGGVFGQQSRGTSYPPDGWHMDTGTWGTDAKLDDGTDYDSPRTGAYGLLLASTATATELYSDPWPVSYGRTYQVMIEAEASNTATVTLEVEWLDAAQASVSTVTLYSSALAASDTWQLVGSLVCPPTGARYARVRVSKAASAFFVLIDRVLFDEVDPVEAEINGVRIFDDFEGIDAPGSLPWQLNQLGSDPATYPTIPSKYASASSTFSWTERGIARLTTPAQSNYGAVIYLGDATSPQFYDLPPVGVAYKIRIRVSVGTNIELWAGLFDDMTTFPDGALANTINGVGVRVSAAGSSANWKVIARSGTSETSVDLGVSAVSTWRTIGFMRTVSGIQPIIGDHPTGSEITTNLPSATGLSMCHGVYTKNAAAKALDVDFVQLAGRFRRYDP